MNNSKRCNLTLVGWACALFAYAVPGIAKDTTLNWAVIPQFSSVTTHKNWAPVLKYLEKNTNVKFRLLLYDNFSRFSQDMNNGIADIAYVNPYQAVLFRKTQSYTPIVRDAHKKLSGVLVVRKDSGVKSLSQLSGTEIAFPAPSAFGASVYLRALLIREHKLSFKPVYTGSHSNVYRSVLFNRTPAGGGVLRTLKSDLEQVGQHLRVLYHSPPITPHPIVVHPRVPILTVNSIVAEILDMSNDPLGSVLLKNVKLSKPARSDYDKDYGDLELLKLEELL